MANAVRPLKIGAVDTTGPAFKSAANNVDKLNRRMGAANDTVRKTTGSFRAMRGGMGQIGYQIQDIAVQLQAGTSPFIALTQQGSQMASVFGPGGIIVGAIGAVAGSLAVALMPKLIDSKSAIQKVEEATKDMAVAFKVGEDGALGLSKGLKGLMDEGDDIGARLARAAGLEAARERVGAMFEKSGEESGDSFGVGFIKFMGKALSGSVMQPSLVSPEVPILTNLDIMAGHMAKAWDIPLATAMDAMGAMQLASETGTADASRVAANILGNIDLGSNAMEGANKMLYDFYTTYKRLVEVADQQSDLESGLLPGNELHDSYMAVIEWAGNSADATAEAEAKKRAAWGSSMSMMGQYTGSLANALGQQNALGKAAFLATKAFAIGNAIVSTHDAAAQALAIGGPTYGPALQKTMLALGYAQVGVIAATTLASFEGGGMTRAGARAGGIDGRGGMAAVLHPSEKITDMESAAPGGTANITFQITALDAAGIDEIFMRRKSMIMRMMRDGLNERGDSLGRRA